MSDLLIVFGTLSLLTVTPGPNNLLLASSGVQFGLRRSLPMLLGIVLGFPLLTLCVGLGLGPVFQAVPAVQVVLKVLAAAYLLLLAWQVATTRALADAASGAAPIGFLKMAGFQWVNPKVWSMAITVTSAVMVSDRIDVRGAVLAALIIMATTSIFNTAWLVVGALLRDWLSIGQRIVWFNRVMGVLLAGFVVSLLLS
ncbi:MAG: LysE family translocator [Alphaproteobacteria bacterium]